MTLKRNIKNNKRYNIYIFNTCILDIIFKLGFTSVSRQTVTRYYNYCSERECEFLIHSIILKCMSFNIIISFWGSFSEKMHKIEQPNCRFFWQKVTIERDLLIKKLYTRTILAPNLYDAPHLPVSSCFQWWHAVCYYNINLISMDMSL